MSLVAAAAQRLKAVLPSLADAPGAARSEVFIVYSVLKHLAREMECAEASSRDRRAALGKLVQGLRRLARVHSEEAWARRLLRLIEADQAGNGSDGDAATDGGSRLVAALADEIGDADCPDWVGDQVMAWIVDYLATVNVIEMSVYREAGGPAAAGAERKREGRDDG